MKNSGYKKYSWEFPGGLVVRSLRFQCCGPGSVPGQGTKIPEAAQHGQKKKIFFFHIFTDLEPLFWTKLGPSEEWRKLRPCSANCILCNRFQSLLMISAKYRRRKLESKFKSANKIVASIIWQVCIFLFGKLLVGTFKFCKDNTTECITT